MNGTRSAVVVGSRGLAIRAIAAFGILMIVAGVGQSLLIAPLFFLPESTLSGLFPSPDDLIHLVHAVGVSLTYWIAALALAAQVWRPGRDSAALWVVALMVVGSAILDLAAGTFMPETLIYLVLVAALLVLQPRATLRIKAVDRPVLAVGLVGAAALVVLGLDQGRLQLTGSAADPHLTIGHYTTMAVLAWAIAAGAIIGATDAPGHRLAAWLAGVSAMIYGLASLLHAVYASALPAPLAVAVVAWAVAYIVVAAIRRQAAEGPVHVAAELPPAADRSKLGATR